MHLVATVFRYAVQAIVIIALPGGLPLVLIYQYRRFKQRQAAKIPAQGVEPAPKSPQ